MSTAIERVLALARTRGAIRAADLAARRIPVRYLGRLRDRGLLTRIDRGLYEAAGRELSEHATIAAAARRVPHGVLCLLSALQYHGITTQQPAKVWMAIGRNSRAPRAIRLPIRIVRFSDKALTEGIQTARIEGVAVRVYSPAKTVVDCFKYRNRIGLDVAMEALREGRRSRKVSHDELWRFAKVCRVANVMRPYLEVIG